MGRKRKVSPSLEKEIAAAEPATSTTKATPSPSPTPKKRAKRTRATPRAPPKKSKAQKRPKRAIQQAIELEVKDLRTQLQDEIERNKEQLRRFGAAQELALRELDQMSGVTWIKRAAEEA